MGMDAHNLIGDNMNASLTTNGHYRPLLHYEQLTRKEQKEYIDKQDIQFFRYRRSLYILDDFLTNYKHTCPILGYYDGYSCDSFFSSVWIRFSDCGEAVQVASLCT